MGKSFSAKTKTGTTGPLAKRTRKKKTESRVRRWARVFRRWLFRGVLAATAFILLWIVIYAVVPVPTTPYIIGERIRLGAIERDWVPMEEISPNLARAVVAAEDANFCKHFGFPATC